MAIDDLTEILPMPPGIPVAGSAYWVKAETELGSRLPEDYKAFVDGYGPGRIAEFIGIYSPFTYNVHANLISQAAVQLGALRQLETDFGEVCPYPLFPLPGGLLPFGQTDNGDGLYWLTTGEPDDWSVVIGESRGPRFEPHQCGMAAFLAELLTGRRSSAFFPDDDLPWKPCFEPLRDAH